MPSSALPLDIAPRILVCNCAPQRRQPVVCPASMALRRRRRMVSPGVQCPRPCPFWGRCNSLSPVCCDVLFLLGLRCCCQWPVAVVCCSLYTRARANLFPSAATHHAHATETGMVPLLCAALRTAPSPCVWLARIECVCVCGFLTASVYARVCTACYQPRCVSVWLACIECVCLQPYGHHRW